MQQKPFVFPDAHFDGIWELLDPGPAFWTRKCGNPETHKHTKFAAIYLTLDPCV